VVKFAQSNRGLLRKIALPMVARRADPAIHAVWHAPCHAPCYRDCATRPDATGERFDAGIDEDE